MNNSNKILSTLFIGAMGYQLFCVNTANIENSGNSIKGAELIHDTIFAKIKEVKNREIKPLVKPFKYKLSKNGKDFIKAHETCVLKAYNDPDPKRRSVGWGHQIQPGEKLERITKKKADELFEKDIEWVNDAINRLIKKNDDRFIYSQGFIDGLGSLIYNCGERGVTLTKFWKRWQSCRYDKNTQGYINSKDWKYTLEAVKTSRVSAPGHIERRKGEYELMMN